MVPLDQPFKSGPMSKSEHNQSSAQRKPAFVVNSCGYEKNDGTLEISFEIVKNDAKSAPTVKDFKVKAANPMPRDRSVPRLADSFERLNLPEDRHRGRFHCKEHSIGTFPITADYLDVENSNSDSALIDKQDSKTNRIPLRAWQRKRLTKLISDGNILDFMGQQKKSQIDLMQTLDFASPTNFATDSQTSTPSFGGNKKSIAEFNSAPNFNTAQSSSGTCRRNSEIRFASGPTGYHHIHFPSKSIPCMQYQSYNNATRPDSRRLLELAQPRYPVMKYVTAMKMQQEKQERLRLAKGMQKQFVAGDRLKDLAVPFVRHLEESRKKLGHLLNEEQYYNIVQSLHRSKQIYGKKSAPSSSERLFSDAKNMKHSEWEMNRKLLLKYGCFSPKKPKIDDFDSDVPFFDQ